MLELISPAGFEGYFAAQADALESGTAPDADLMASLLERYGLEMDLDSLPGLLEGHGLVLPGAAGREPARADIRARR